MTWLLILDDEWEQLDRFGPGDFFAIPGKGLLVGDGKVCLVGRRSGLEGSGGHYDPVGRL
jgi:hypothetical protein